MILHCWMAFFATQSAPRGKRPGDERNALIEFHVRADFRGLPDNDACAVIDEKMASDFRPGMNIDSGPAMGPFRHHARDEWQVGPVEDVGHALNRDRFERG